MDKVYSLESLKKEIERKQEELNELVVSKRNKKEILILSMELDDVINLYNSFSI